MHRLRPYKTVLLVEDDDDVAETLAEVLRETGRVVERAKDGIEALQKLDDIVGPCLILLDLVMPRMDGFQFLERLKDHPHASDTSVIITSAVDGNPAGRYPRVLGTLPKPFDLETLLARISES